MALFSRTSEKKVEFNIGIIGSGEDERVFRKSFVIKDKARLGVLRIGSGRLSDVILTNPNIQGDQGYIEIFFMDGKIKLTYTNSGNIPAQISLNGKVIKVLGKEESFDIDKRCELIFGNSKVYILHKIFVIIF